MIMTFNFTFSSKWSQIKMLLVTRRNEGDRMVSVCIVYTIPPMTFTFKTAIHFSRKNTKIKCGPQKPLKFWQYCQNANFITDKGICKCPLLNKRPQHYSKSFGIKLDSPVTMWTGTGSSGTLEARYDSFTIPKGLWFQQHNEV